MNTGRFNPAHHFQTFISVLICYAALSVQPLALASTDTTQTLQPPRLSFHHFTTRDGLSSNHITALLQDKQGFLWVGTINGLNRFDGYRFTSLQQIAEPSEVYPAGAIKDLLEDHHGVIWIATDTGLFSFNPFTNKLAHFQHSPGNLQSLSDNRVTRLALDQQNNLWVGTQQGGVNRLQRQTGQFIHLQHNAGQPESLLSNRIRALAIDDNNQLWIGHWRKGLDKYDIYTGKITHYQHDANNPHSLNNNNIYRILPDPHGGVWIGSSSRGLNFLNPLNNHFTHYTWSDNETNSIFNNWVTAMGFSNVNLLTGRQSPQLILGNFGGGFSLFNDTNQHFHNYQHIPALPDSLSDNYVNAIYTTKRGGIWIGTNKGLNFVNPRATQFEHYAHQPGIESSLQQNDVRGFYQRSTDALWIATYKGLASTSKPNKHVFEYFPLTLPERRYFKMNRLYAVAEDKQGVAWTATHNLGITRFNPDTQKITIYRPIENDAKSISHNIARVIQQAEEGSYWVGTDSGLDKFDTTTGTFTRLQYSQPNHTASYSTDPLRQTILSLTTTKSGELWVGTAHSGLAVMHSNDFDKSGRIQPERVTLFQVGKDTNHALVSNRVNALHTDHRGGVWIATQNNGFYYSAPGSHSLINVHPDDSPVDRTMHSPLSQAAIAAIIEDDQYNLWVSSDKGLTRITADSLAEFTRSGDASLLNMEHFTQFDGLQHNEFNQGAAYKAPDGELFFGGKNGFNRFYPDDIPTTTFNPTLVFTRFMVNNQPYQRQSESPTFTRSLSLEHQQNALTTEFTALNVLNPKSLEYSWRLTGWQNDWQQAPWWHRVASLTNIPPGRYQLDIRVRKQGQQWHPETLSLPLTIHPPWWLTAGMKVLYAILLVVIFIIAIYRLTIVPGRRAARLEQQVMARTRDLAQNRDMLEKLHQANIHFAQNISHSLRTPLNLILGPVERMLLNKQVSLTDLNRIKRNALRLQKDINSLVTFSASAVFQQQTLIRYHVSCLSRQLGEDFAVICQSKGLTFETRIEPDIYATTEPEAIERILINLLENAVKYTPSGGNVRLVVRSIEQSNYIELAVSDTGEGIPPQNQQAIFIRGFRLENSQSEQGTGIGLAFVKELVARHNGLIDLTSAPGHGATFVVRLPIHPTAVTTGADTNDQDTENTTSVSNPTSNTREFITTVSTLIQHHGEQLSQPHSDTQRAGHKRRILIVEDNDDMAAFIAEALAKDYFCRVARNGQEGIQQAIKRQPDLIVTDMMMPEKSGTQLLATLKQNASTSHIPVIVVTAANDRDGQVHALQAGAIHYFTKPFNEREFIKAVNKALSIQTEAQDLIERYLLENTPITHIDFPYIEPADIQLLNQFAAHLHQHYANPEFSNPVQSLSQEVFIEPRTLRRKLSAFLTENPAIILRHLRLEYARQQLSQGQRPVDVFAAVGFSSADYFSRCFKQRYHQTPGEYQKQLEQQLTVTD